jgi:hypothetical protein
MKDYRDIMPNVPVIEGWTTTNYRDHARNGEVAKMQGFVGVDYNGQPAPPRKTAWNDDTPIHYIGVPEGKFHSDEQYWPRSRDEAVRDALNHVNRLIADANRIMASIDRAMSDS